MLTRKTPEKLTTKLTVKGQGVPTFDFNVTYHNRTQASIQEAMDKARTHDAAKTDDQYANRAALLHVVDSWESEYPLTDEGVKEMEDDRPGMVEIIFIGFHKSRRVESAKN